MFARFKKAPLVVLPLLALAPAATAAVNVTVFSQSGEDVEIANLSGNTSSPYDVKFTIRPDDGTQNSVSAPVVRVQATNGETINSILVDIDLPVGASRVNLVVNGTGGGLSGVGNISRDTSIPNGSTGGELWVQSIIAMNSVFGAIDAHRVLYVETTSDLSIGDIIATITEATSAISTASRIVIDAARDITGDLTLKTPVEDIHAAGDIGQAMDPIVITCDREVDSIEANHIFAEITINATTGTGLLRRMVTDGGSFTGDLVAEGIENATGGGMFIDVDLNADVTLNSAVLQRPIIIGQLFHTGRTIWIKAEDGLGAGAQITINNEYMSEDDWWLGSVKVGTSSPITITADPDYSTTAEELGGGSVGLAPFYLHGTSCLPAHQHYMSGTNLEMTGWGLECVPNDANVAYLRFYGPVAIDGDDIAVTVEHTTAYPVYTDVSDDFETSIDSGDHRFVVVRRKESEGRAWPLGLYRITPEAGRLVCEGVVEAPDVQPNPYAVTVVDGCEEFLLGMFDLNDDEELTYAGDVGAWLENPVDLNNDNVADEDDLPPLLTAIEMFNE